MNLDIAENIQTTILSVLGELENDKDIFKYLKLIIENVERENLKGNEKKNLAIRILEDIIKVSSLDNAKQTYCLSLIEHGVISNSIDLIISAASGDLEVNMDINTAQAACSQFILPCGYSLLKASKKKL
tara:strand:- start:1224 stop:1610 length:387 start_codon:yes stop_codon:yes gene_type:complete